MVLLDDGTDSLYLRGNAKYFGFSGRLSLGVLKL